MARETWELWASVSTAGAFLVALVVFIFGVVDRRRANADRLRDQASKVWILADDPEYEPPGPPPPESLFADVRPPGLDGLGLDVFADGLQVPGPGTEGVHGEPFGPGEPKGAKSSMSGQTYVPVQTHLRVEDDSWASVPGQTYVRVRWTLHNTSDAPIFRCRVNANLRSKRDFGLKMLPDIVKQGGERSHIFPHLRYSGSGELPGDKQSHIFQPLRYSGDGNWPGAVVYFTDAAGVRWRRDSLGNLDLKRRPRRGTRRGHRPGESLAAREPPTGPWWRGLRERWRYRQRRN